MTKNGILFHVEHYLVELKYSSQHRQEDDGIAKQVLARMVCEMLKQINLTCGRNVVAAI